MSTRSRHETRRETRGRQPEGLRASVVEAGSTFLVLTFPLPPAELDDPLLTDAERAVARGLLAGRSNVEIAAARGTSARTVANQIQSVFRKLGVASRAELAARAAGRRDE